MKSAIRFVTVAACSLIWGCGTPDVNPPASRTDTGYVDFYTDTVTDLFWDVKRASESGAELDTVFVEYKPLPGNILRLAAPPGRYRFQIWFSNEITTGPQSVEVPVENGQVTPVHVTLTPAGSVLVESTSYRYRPTARATRRVSRIASNEEQTLRIDAKAAPPEPYRPKERMPYWASKSE